MAIDVDRVKGSRLLSEIVGDRIEIKKNGSEFQGCCPFHEEKTPSFTISDDKGFYHCFGCGAHGDAIDFVAEYDRVSFKEACKIVGGEQVATGEAPKKRPPRKAPEDIYSRYKPVNVPGDTKIPVGKKLSVINPKREHESKPWTPSMVFPYRLANGEIFGFVLRLEFGDGKKITPAIRYDRDHGWVAYPFGDSLRPIYRLPELLASTGQVVVVEGEKAADHLASRISLPVISWSGGTNGIDKTDWGQLKGRSVILVPDHDPGGYKAMDWLLDHLQSIGASSIKTVIPEADHPKGWDVADQEWDQSSFVAWAKQNLGEIPADRLPEPKTQAPNSGDSAPTDTNPDQPPSYDDMPIPDYEPTGDMPPPPADDNDMRPPFRILGHYRGIRYYLPESTQQVVDLTPAQHTKNNLLALAPMEHWLNMSWDITTKDGMDAAVNGLLQMSSKTGLFNGDRLRGRGAWLDEGRAVVHMGQELYVDGKPMRPEHIDSKFIYQQDIDLGVRLVNPANNQQANRLPQLCGQLSWERSLSATLLTGWCVIAPLTGVLPWRPHIWVTGPSGSGKTTVLKSIISVMLGDIALLVEGKTTEAGIRQQLGIDARPVLFDEAEAEDKQSIDRLKGILDFARVCSSGGKIVKGTASGHSISFTARTAFCFSSINTSVNHYADESRISQLVMRQDFTRSSDFYEKLEKEIFETITPDYAASMFSRSVQYMAVLRDNCQTFVEAANIHFRSRRIADQVGVLLAGAYLCYSSKRIDRDAALEWIRKHNWEDHTAVGTRTDRERLVSKILTYRLRIPTSGMHIELSLGEAIMVASRDDLTHPLDSHHDDCHKELKRYGIMVEDGRIWIANVSDPMSSKVLRDTPWASSWGRTLAEIEGSEKTKYTYFAPGVKSRAVSLPLSIILYM